MCGILGVVSGEQQWNGLQDTCKFLRQGATTGVLRGIDSTGMFQVDKRNVVDVHKLPISGNQFVETRRATSMINKADSSRITIMHHRAATRGSVNYENTHPFTHADEKRMLVGVHNGSLNNTPATYDGMSFDVDSDYAFYRIFKEGKEAFKNLYGAYALVWWENDGKLRIVCNGQRDLHFAFIHKKNAMLIASEEGMLSWLAQRNDIKLDAILRPDEHKLLTFDPSKELRDFEDESISKPHYKATATVVNNTYRGGSNTNFPHRQETLPSVGGAGGGFSLAVGKEVLFYPTMAESDSKQLVGQVQIPSGSSDGPQFRYLDAILSCANPSLYSNIKANSIDFLTAKIRAISTHMPEDKATVLLLLSDPEIGVGEEKEDRVEQSDDEWAEGPGGGTIGPLEFSLLTKDGCAICTKTISWSSAKKGSIGWDVNSKQAICGGCAKQLEAA